MQYSGIAKGSLRLGPKVAVGFAARIKMYMMTFTIKRKPKGPPSLPTDWYRRNITAQEQGEFWVHTLLGR